MEPPYVEPVYFEVRVGPDGAISLLPHFGKHESSGKAAFKGGSLHMLPTWLPWQLSTCGFCHLKFPVCACIIVL